MRFSLKKVKLNVFCKVIDKDNIVFQNHQTNEQNKSTHQKILFQEVDKKQLKKYRMIIAFIALTRISGLDT